jgi:hypothetical protein
MTRLDVFRLAPSAWVAAFAIACGPAVAAPPAIDTGTMTWGGVTPETTIIHVTSLEDSGPGSLRDALATIGPRVIVFDVAGTIALKSDLRIDYPEATLAGQTAPSPGITLLGRPLRIKAPDVVVQHVAIRPFGVYTPEEYEELDAITVTTCGSCDTPTTDVLIENVSTTWAVDENIGLWGDRLQRVTIRNSLIAEGLAEAGHPKGVHSMGLLVGEKVSGVEITGNLFASNLRRNPVIGGGASAFVANNFIYNPGRNSVHIYEGAETRASLIGNVTRAGPDTHASMTAFQNQGDPAVDSPGARVYAADNYCCDGRTAGPAPSDDGQAPEPQPVTVASHWTLLAPGDVWGWVSRFAGSRPAARDAIDSRIVAGVEAGTGRVRDEPDLPTAALGSGGAAGAPPAVPTEPLSPSAIAGKSRLAAWLCLRHREVGGPPTPQCPETPDELRAALGAS